MFATLVSHNPDLQALVDKGYAVGFDDGYLIVRDIPYLNDKLEQEMGAFVTKLVFVDTKTVQQEDHQVFFAGSHPHNIDGTPIRNLAGGPTSLALNEVNQDVVVQRSFSNKPKDSGAYVDFFDKIENYTAIISGPAISLHKANPLTFRIKEEMPDSVFLVHDTMTSRSEISDLSSLLKDDVIAIFGLGGTGSYLLDFLVRTPVREVRGFDPDRFHLHTAFRSPGGLDVGELGLLKAEVYEARFRELRKGVSMEPLFVDASTEPDLSDVTFAFVCVDRGESRKGIIEILVARNIPFIDVGLGLGRETGPISGLIRTTYFPPGEGNAVFDAKLAPTADPPDHIYRTQMQVGELNALNACLAVIRFKQLRGFYASSGNPHQQVFDISDLQIANLTL